MTTQSLNHLVGAFAPAQGSRDARYATIATRSCSSRLATTWAINGSILPLGRRAGSHRAAGTCSSVNDQQCLAAVQVLSGTRHGTTRIGSFCPTHLS